MPTRLPCGHVVRDPGQTHYCTYLALDRLLALQPGPDAYRHPDEHLFVVTHQAYELWFAQLRVDLPRIIAALDDDQPGLATWLMKRCTDVVRMFGPMMRVLETMAPADFYAFRGHLVPASGGESWQWHECELLAGARDDRFRKMLQARLSEDGSGHVQTELWLERLQALWDGPSIRTAAEALFARRGVRPADAYAVAPAPNPNADLMLLAEAMLDFDEEVRIWRFLHGRTAERTIGPETEGTGATTGVRYLDMAAVHRQSFFPFLWEARGELWTRVNEAPGGG